MKPFIVGIGGGSGSGKSTVAQLLIDELGESDVVLLSQDHYYSDLSHLTPDERKNQNFDHPDALDHELMKEQLELLSNGKSMECPRYDFKSHCLTGETTTIEPKPVILLDGIFSLYYEEILPLLDLKLYVDVPDDVRILRRMTRDIAKRGRTVEGVVQQYLGTVRHMHDTYVEPTKWSADIVVAWGQKNPSTIGWLAKMIRTTYSE
jgi:uridine kinase